MSKEQSHKLLFSVFFNLPSPSFKSPNEESTVLITGSPAATWREAADRRATSVTHGATSRSFSPPPRQLPHLQLWPIMFVGTRNQAGGAAAGTMAKLKPLYGI